jgi:hypothetical protein
MKMKFPIESGVGKVRGNQWTARQCYNVTLKGMFDKASLGTRCKEEEK